jgi:preprotein translocase subunit SecF
MRLIQFVPANTKIRFMRVRYFALGFSLFVCLVSIASAFVQGFNFGIDFQGGILMEIRTKGPADISGLRTKLNGLGLGDIQLQGFGRPDDVLIRIQRQEGSDAAQSRAVEKVRAALGSGIDYRRVESVGPKVSGELIHSGVLATVVALAAIMVYIWFRFEWQFGVGATIATLHDVISMIGLFSVFQLEFDLTTVAAVLTIAGYSVNDTVVVYDRLRENLRKYKAMPLEQLIDLSINETLSRTILTSTTTLLAVLALFLFGGPVIHGFSLAMIWGIVFGTYSSIYVAAPMLVYFNLRRSTFADEPEQKQKQPAKP